MRRASITALMAVILLVLAVPATRKPPKPPRPPARERDVVESGSSPIWVQDVADSITYTAGITNETSTAAAVHFTLDVMVSGTQVSTVSWCSMC